MLNNDKAENVEKMPAAMTEDIELDIPSTNSDAVINSVSLGEKSPSAIQKYSLLNNLKKSVVWFVATLLIVLGVTTLGRSMIDSLLSRIDAGKNVHPDSSIIDPGIKSQTNSIFSTNKVILVYHDDNGKPLRVLADKEEVSAFARNSINKLETARVSLNNTLEERVNENFSPVFDSMRNEIANYADWFFGWGTSYKIMYEAILSAADHTFKAEAVSLKDAVSYDLERYLEEHFEKMVLRPEINDPRLNKAVKSSLESLHRQYLLTVVTLGQDFQKFVAEKTTHLSPLDAARVKVTFDWDAQVNKANIGVVAKDTTEAARGTSIVFGGAMFGGMLGKRVGNRVTVKTLSRPALKAFLPRMTGPFVSKVTTASAGGFAGSWAGILGFGAGALTGLGIDYLVSEGVEIAGRAAFVNNTKATLSAIQDEWATATANSLKKSVDIWFMDSINLYIKFEKTLAVSSNVAF